MFESTRKAYKSWVKFRNTISWKYAGGIPPQLLKVCNLCISIELLYCLTARGSAREMNKKKEHISFRQFVIDTIFFNSLQEAQRWTQISEPLGQYLGIPYPSTQLTPSSAGWCPNLTLRHRHRSRKHLQCRSPSQSLSGFGCTRLLCENSLQVSSMDRVLMVLDLSQ